MDKIDDLSACVITNNDELLSDFSHSIEVSLTKVK
jgi:hypothetical protein